MESITGTEKIKNISEIFGAYDNHVKLIEKAFSVKILLRGEEIRISGEAEGIKKAEDVLHGLIRLQDTGEAISEQEVRYAITMAEDGIKLGEENTDSAYVCVTEKGKPVKGKTLGQKKYIEAIRKDTVVICIGPAGTGKTYLAVALAVDAFRKKQVSRIILTRPAVEAGEKLGFLPGDLQNKVDPYLRPLYDALSDMLGLENMQKYQERGIIEVAPLAYMRGRTLDDAFIILDEAQNTTPEQMKMFLTRIGFNSKAVITGDVTQIDLPDGKRSGLRDAERILKGIDDDIEFIYLSYKDVVRHPLVQKIINAYEAYANRRKSYEKK